MKKIFLAMIALSATVAVAAQTRQIDLQKGDSIKLSRSCTHYLTGEAIPAWVYDVPITVMQVGGKTYPEGILIKEVISWVPMQAVGAKFVNGEEVPQVEPEPVKPVQPVQPVQPAQPTQPVQPVQPVQPEQPAPEPIVEEVISTDRPAEHRFGIGLRGGVASLCQLTEERVVNGKRQLGGEGALDLEYTYLSPTLNSGNCQVGVKTGLSLAFGGNSLTADGAITGYSMKDIDGRDISYINSAYGIQERDMQLMIEVPLMFALRGTKGFSFAIGPKLNVPVLGRYKMDYVNSIIDCYYVKENVHEINEVVTGRLNGVAASQDNKLRTATFNLMMASELGYEWALKNGNGFGLLVYGGYYVASDYKLNSDPTKSFIYVNGPKAGGPDITGNALMNDCGINMGYLSAGIKLTYQFSFPKK